MAWFGEADHAANPPPYLTLWWIPVSNTYESMPNPVHMDTTYWWHILVPHTEYTHKYNHAGIKTWGKWLQKQLISATQRAWHRTAPHYGIRTLDISRSIASIALSIACNTSSDKLYECINACLIFATQNHGDSLPHDAGCESNATLRPKLSRTFTHQCLHAHQCKRVAESSNQHL